MIVDDKGIKDSWKEYMEKLMNEESEWDHKLSAEAKEGPAVCIRMDEVSPFNKCYVGNAIHRRLHCVATSPKL